MKKYIIFIFSIFFISIIVLPVSANILPQTSQTVVSTELINFYSMTTTEMNIFINTIHTQEIPLIILRLNAMSEFQTGTSSGITKAKEFIQIANNNNIQVSIDLHTWYTTWDNYFDDTASNYVSHRGEYLTYITNVLSAFSNTNVYSFMILNEPQAQTASSNENSFILSCISTAKTVTDKPISIRFMCGYSPSTGHYSTAIDSACDFLCRNTYWDPRYPATTVYGTTEAKINTAISTAHNQNKGIWFTEFGKTNSNTETQRAYVAAFVSWAKTADIDAIFCWVCQPDSSGETYNIFNGYTPLPAFYELVNENVIIPTPIPTASVTVTPHPTNDPTPTYNPIITPIPTTNPTPTIITEQKSFYFPILFIAMIFLFLSFKKNKVKNNEK